MTRLRIALTFALALTLAACGGGTADAPADTQPQVVALAAKAAAPARVASLTLPALTIATVGTPLTLAATAKDKNGKSITGAAIAWTSADTSIATVTSGGIVNPLRAGFTTIRASAGSVVATTTLSVRGATPIPVRSNLVGTNLSGIAYYSTQFPFVDLMKSSSGWNSFEDGGAWGAAFPALTADGYPASLKAGQHAVAAVAWNNSHYPAGRYVVLWDGDGSVSFPMSPQATIAQSAANRIAIDVTATSGALWVGIDRTNPANPVRNLRFLMPGAEATYASRPFNPDFLARTAPFSTLRFMDWGGTNGSPVIAWADRAHVGDLTFQSKGVPLEVMIDLANTLHVDPWFCIPHQATDDYVKQFATLLRGRLDPGLRPHIEYSNEVWNPGFSQTQWALQQSTALGLDAPFGQPSLFYAKRSVQIFKIVQQVYGADSARIVRVLAGQAAWTQFLDSALAWNDTAANADVTAVAPYFRAGWATDPANVDATLALTTDQLVDLMLSSVQGEVKSWMTASAAQAQRYKLKMKGYESGPGDSTYYFPDDKRDAVTALFDAANRSPRMRDLYAAYYAQWKAAGGGTMNQYNDIGAWSIYGFWGALEYTTQPIAGAPKYQGLLDVIAANPAP